MALQNKDDNGHSGMGDINRQAASRLVSASIILFSVLAVAAAWKLVSFPPDLSALYAAARFYAMGEYDLVYAAPKIFFGGTAPEWLPYLAELGLEGEEPLPYVYPPLWAALFAPLAAAVAPQTFFQIIGAVLFASIAGSVLVAWRLARGFAIPLWSWIILSAVLLATSVISFIAVYHLQIQILVVFLCLLAFERYRAGRAGTAGAILALAAALKLAPAGFALLFLLDRNWRALGVFTVIGGGLGLSSLAIAGIDLHWAFLDSIRLASTGLFVSSVSLSFEVLLQAAASISGLTPPIDFAQRNVWVADTGAVIGAINKLLLLGGLVWMIRRTAELAEGPRLAVRVFALSLLLNLFGPLGWAHYYMLQLFMLPMVLGLMPRARAALLIAGTAVLTSWPLLLGIRMVASGDFLPAGLSAAVMCVLFVTVVQGRGTRSAPVDAPARALAR